MRTVCVWLAAALVLVASVQPVAAQDDPTAPSGDSTTSDDSLPAPTPTAGPLSAADIAAQVAPSVVQVIVPDGKATGVEIGAGVLTNAHVAGSNTQVDLILPDGSHAQATVARVDTSRDLALLTTSANLPAIGIDLAGQQHQGDPVYILGFPEGIGGMPALTRGLIAAIRLNDHGVNLLQSDAAVSPGSSGSPVLDAAGKLIALHSFTVSGQHFAIASETINEFLAGAPLLSNSPLASNTATGAASPPAPYAGQPEDAAVRAADLGGAWTQVSATRDPSDAATTGAAYAEFKSDSGDVKVTTVVFRNRDLALTFWKQLSGESLEACDASVYQGLGDGVVQGACLVQNVFIEMQGAPYDLTRAALGAAGKRVSTALSPQAAPTPAPSGPLFRAAPTVVALTPADLGSGWTTASQRQDVANQYSSGRLWSTLTQGSGASTTAVGTEIEVYRDVPTADTGFNELLQYVDASPVQVCDAGATWTESGATVIQCRRANVLVMVFAANMPAAQSALNVIVGRINKGMS